MREELSEKETAELAFWKSRVQVQGKLANDHFEYFYTAQFGLQTEFYQGKWILDIGCGPRGSLEWAFEAEVRIGVDPLANEYLQLGTARHAMEYVACGAENLPFPDAGFDVVSSLNSLDHVDDLDRTISEIGRVTVAGGLFLLITDIHRLPTDLEPNAFSWDIVDRFPPEFEILSQIHLEQSVFSPQGFADIYSSLKKNVPFDHSDQRERNGILAVKFRKLA